MKQLIFLLTTAALLLLSLAACTDSELLDNGRTDLPDVSLRPGEQPAYFTLQGVGAGGAVEARAVTDPIALEGETDITRLDVYCFVNLTAANPGEDATSTDDYTLERVYRYAVGGAANDFVLQSAGSDRRFGIGVPDDDRLRRFLVVANDNYAAGDTDYDTDRGVTAVPVGTVATTDRSGATTYATVSDWVLKGCNRNSILVCPLAMSSKAEKAKRMNDGSYTYVDEPYNLAELTAGITVRLQRRVARIDISNPASNGFSITGLSCLMKSTATVFNGGQATIDDVTVSPPPSVAEGMLSAAAYCYPGSCRFTIRGTYQGANVTVAVPVGSGGLGGGPSVELAANTRYVIRINNIDRNLTATLEVLPWEGGEELEGKLTNDGYAPAVAAMTGWIGGDGYYAVIDDANRTLRIAANTITGKSSGDADPMLRGLPQAGDNLGVEIGNCFSYPFLKLTGEGKPVGVILPDELIGRVSTQVVEGTAATGEATPMYLYLRLIPTAAEDAFYYTGADENMSAGEERSAASSRGQTISSLTYRTVPSRPLPITFVTQNDKGALVYQEWTLIEDIFTFTEPPLHDVVERMIGGSADKKVPSLPGALPTLQYQWKSDASATDVTAGATVTVSPYAGQTEILAIGGNIVAGAYADGGDWLQLMGIVSGSSGSVDVTRGSGFPIKGTETARFLAVEDNGGTEMRQGAIVMRSFVQDDTNFGNDHTHGTVTEVRYPVVQPPITAETQKGLASAVDIVLESGHKLTELYREGNTIHVNYGAAQTVLQRRAGDDAAGTAQSDKMKQTTLSITPFCMVSDGGKPVRIILPVGCDWVIPEVDFTQLYQSVDSPVPPGIVRNFRLLPNYGAAARSVRFEVQTYTNGKVQSTYYEVVQEITPEPTTGDGGGAQPPQEIL